MKFFWNTCGRELGGGLSVKTAKKYYIEKVPKQFSFKDIYVIYCKKQYI